MAKTLLCLLLSTAVISMLVEELAGSAPLITQAFVDDLNSQGDWTASREWAGDMTVGEFRRMLSQTKPPERRPRTEESQPVGVIPSAFDTRTAWPECSPIIRSSGNCTASWAIMTADTWSDRLCISTGASTNVRLSPMWLLSCDLYDSGCSGGDWELAWAFMKSNGVPTESCSPYTPPTSYAPSCSYSCYSMYYAYSITRYWTIPGIQTAITTAGPVMAMMAVYQDFISYTSGVYSYKKGSLLGYVYVKILGWGTSAQNKYWIVALPFGSKFGLQGYAWVAFGQCGIDSKAMAGIP